MLTQDFLPFIFIGGRTFSWVYLYVYIVCVSVCVCVCVCVCTQAVNVICRFKLVDSNNLYGSLHPISEVEESSIRSRSRKELQRKSTTC